MNRTPVLILLVLLAISIQPALAGTLPGDRDGDSILTREELAGGILSFLACSTGEDCAGAPDELEVIDAVTVYTLWGGVPKQVTDSTGKVRTLTRPLRRVVVMNGETLETMRSLGVEPYRIVAVERYTGQKPEFFPEFQNTPSVGSIWAPDYERILSARPDAVFLYATVSAKECDEIEQRITSANPGITIFRIDCYHPETYLGDIRILGEIFDRQEESEQLAGFYRGILDALALGLSGRTGPWPAVYFETWNDYRSVGPGSGYHDKIAIAGGRNIFADSAASYPDVDPEAVISRQPGVVVKIVGTGQYSFGGYSGVNTSAFGPTRATLLSRAGWDAIPAVREGRVFLLHNALIGGPQYIIGEAYLAGWFHPGVFADLDAAGLHRTYISRFQGLDPSLADPVRFVFPVP